MAHILIIDDDPALLDVLALALEDEGHEVQTAEDGMRGLERLRARPPELVVSDINMPELDGFALCRELRADGFRAPIIR